MREKLNNSIDLWINANIANRLLKLPGIVSVDAISENSRYKVTWNRMFDRDDVMINIGRICERYKK